MEFFHGLKEGFNLYSAGYVTGAGIIVALISVIIQIIGLGLFLLLKRK